MSAPLAQVFKCQFWMWHYESRTPKPTVLWSSSRAITKFWVGKLKRAQVKAEQQKRNPDQRGPPVKRWIDKEGRERFKGTFDLRATGSLVLRSNILVSVVSLIPCHCSVAFLGLGSYRSSFHVHLRQYTAAFGQKIAHELHSLIKFTPRPFEQDELESMDAMAIWSAWGWEDLWPMADMTDFVKYLYGAKGLKIPAEWAPHLPREL